MTIKSLLQRGVALTTSACLTAVLLLFTHVPHASAASDNRTAPMPCSPGAIDAC